jgi:2-dehydropantoate 2-reductase
MRIVVFGTGAIGGAVAAVLQRAGQDVLGISRGAQFEAIRNEGLRLLTPTVSETIRFPVVQSLDKAAIRTDDMILLAIKGQDTQEALEALRSAGAANQPIFCLQNGVTNEDAALRLFPNVHAVTVMMPSVFITPGEVAVQSAPKLGLFYTGRYPRGSDTADTAFAEAMTSADIATFVKEDVMPFKYGKLFLNLSNILIAALGRGAPIAALRERVRTEAAQVLTAAGIGWENVDQDHPDRLKYMNFADVPGYEGTGSSTAQSFLRKSARVETDWLNGEIVRLGRLHDTPVPVNAYLTALAARMSREGAEPGSLSLEEVEAGLAAFEQT